MMVQSCRGAMVKVGLIVLAFFFVRASGQQLAASPAAPQQRGVPAPANILEIDDPPSGAGTPVASAPLAPAPLAPGATPAPPTALLRFPSPPVLSPPAPVAVEAPPTSAPLAVAPPSSPADVPPSSTPTDAPPIWSPADAPMEATPTDAPPSSTPADFPPTPVADKNAMNPSPPHPLLCSSLAATAPSSIPNKAGVATGRTTVKRIVAGGFALAWALPVAL